MKDMITPGVHGTEFKTYAQKRIVVGVLLSIVALWIFGVILGFFDPTPSVQLAKKEDAQSLTSFGKPDIDRPLDGAVQENLSLAVRTQEEPTVEKPLLKEEEFETTAPSASNHNRTGDSHENPPTRGTAFVQACIEPLEYELTKRFYGWRPNDILQVTDNVNNFQLGVLEVTRRTAVNLAERISRTGSTAAFDIHLERAMNYFMIKADRYMLPSAESKYGDGLEELRKYRMRIENGKAPFYTRADNLIPLLASYENLLGSCDENLVKEKGDDGKPVSFFKADDYFYYAKGAASAMGTILEAVLTDFKTTLESRNAVELLEHAIHSCHRAKGINPIVITEASLSGILANHRANMAAPISHAKFYLGLLIHTLST